MIAGVFSVLIWILDLFTYAIIARAILSWIPTLLPRDHVVIVFLDKVTEPVTAPIRAFMQRMMAGRGVSMPLDISPLIAIILIGFLKRILASAM
jgi:uncharacterized protein YggT (Ycf19 family)